jgi:molybdopterin synthase sulfur carrier subunit
MATVTVRMYATVRDAAGMSEVNLEASDLAELLERLSEGSGSILAEFLESHDRTEGGIVILLNGKNVTTSDLASLPLAEGDEVAIFPPVSGG